MPEPFTKTAKEEKEFSYRSTVGTLGRTEVSAKYGGTLATHLEFAQTKDKSTLKRGALVINSGEIPTLPAESGLQITGKIDQISLDQWIPFTTNYLAERAKLASSATIQAEVHAKLDVKTLEFINRQFSINGLQAQTIGSQWQFLAQGRDLAGTVTLPATKDEPLAIALDHLYWVQNANSGKEVSKKVTIKNQDLPAAEVSIGELYFNQKLVGKIQLTTEKTASALLFQNFSVVHPNYKLTATGQWIDQNGIDRTYAEGKIEAKDLGKALSYWGLNTDIKEAEASLEFDWTWPGSPADFHLNTFSGEAELKIEDGRIY